MSRNVLPVLFSGLDYAMDRLRGRLAGLSVEEYLWEPVEDVWTIHQDAAGWWADPNRPPPDPAPVTTIAWRVWHIADCLASYVSPHLGEWPLSVPDGRWVGEVEPALDALEQSWVAFRERVTTLGEDGIWRALGPGWGPYSDEPWAALVVHAQDEVSHHGAEIALLRDLYLRLG